MLMMEGFHAWRKEQESVRSRAPLPCYMSASDLRPDFDLYMLAAYPDVSTPNMLKELAWQLYLAQICIEGFVEDLEDLQDQIDCLEEVVDSHEDWIDKVSI
jgi:hypothetical protein